MDTKKFLQLIRFGIGHYADRSINDIDWAEAETLAIKHGLTAVLLDGIDALTSQGSNCVSNFPLEMKLNWIGEVLQGYEQRYVSYTKALSEMAKFYNEHGFKMMLLKGYACSLDWPKPEHRPCGDIDIWQFGQWKEADAALAKEKGIKIDSSHHHHTVFYWNDFMVENHYDFINVHHHRSSAEMEKIFKELAKDDTHFVGESGEKIYLPSPNLHALFLLRHTMSHFAATGINLRQILDWGFFTEKHGKEVDWNWLEEQLEHFGMKRLYQIFNAICVEDLGFPVSIFHHVQFDPSLKDKVLKEIITPEIPNEKPKKLIPRIVWKIKRWKANRWKHELCYNDSMWSAFWSGVWNHLLKPSSI